MGHLGGVIAGGGEDVGEHHVIGLPFGGVLAQTQRVEVAVGHAQQLRLAALVGAHVGESVGGSGEGRFRLHGQAVVGQTLLTLLAEAAGDVEGQDHILADLDLADGRADLHDLAHVLVPQGAAGLERGAALVHVQVRTADVGRGDLDDDVAGMLDLRVRYILHCDRSRSFVYRCFHDYFPRCRGMTTARQ